MASWRGVSGAPRGVADSCRQQIRVDTGRNLVRKPPIAVTVSVAVHAITVTGILAFAKTAPQRPGATQLTEVEIVTVDPPPPPAPPPPTPDPVVTGPAVAPVAPVAAPAHVARTQHVEVAAVAPAHG